MAHPWLRLADSTVYRTTRWQKARSRTQRSGAKGRGTYGTGIVLLPLADDRSARRLRIRWAPIDTGSVIL